MKKYSVVVFFFLFYWAGNSFFVPQTSYAKEVCFGGIGVEITQKNDRTFVVSTLKDLPAQKGGLQAKDEILAVDQTSIKGKPLGEIVGMLRGEIGGAVLLTIFRAPNNGTFDVQLVREKICFEESQAQVFEILE